MIAPPRKRAGQGTGSRRIDGLALGVREAAIFVGESEKSIYGQVSRRLIPFRKLAGMIIFLRSELEAWLQSLDGCTLAEALRNIEQLNDGSG